MLVLAFRNHTPVICRPSACSSLDVCVSVYACVWCSVCGCVFMCVCVLVLLSGIRTPVSSVGQCLKVVFCVFPVLQLFLAGAES